MYFTKDRELRIRLWIFSSGGSHSESVDSNSLHSLAYFQRLCFLSYADRRFAMDLLPIQGVAPKF